MRAPLCSVEHVAVEGVDVVVLVGEVDHSNAEAIRLALQEAAGPGGVVADVSAVGFLDSGGVHALLRLAAELARRPARLHLVGPPDCPVARVLAVTDPTGSCPVYGTRAEAVAALTR